MGQNRILNSLKGRVSGLCPWVSAITLVGSDLSFGDASHAAKVS